MPYREEVQVARTLYILNGAQFAINAFQKLLDDGWTIESITPAPTNQSPYWLIILRRTP